MSVPVTHEDLAEALDCFWSASIGHFQSANSDTGFTLLAAIATGFAAVSVRLRELGERASP